MSLNCSPDLAFTKIKMYTPSRVWLQIMDLCRQISCRSLHNSQFCQHSYESCWFWCATGLWFLFSRMSSCSNEPYPQWTDKSSRVILRLIYMGLLICLFHSSLITGARLCQHLWGFWGGLQIWNGFLKPLGKYLNEPREEIFIKIIKYFLHWQKLKSIFFKLWGLIAVSTHI